MLTPGLSPIEHDPQHTAFLALVPLIRGVALGYFRFVRCPGRKDDLVSETVALAWAWHRRLLARGRDPSRFATTFARLAVRAVGCGRRVCGQEPARDVLSHTCQVTRSVRVVPVTPASVAGTPEIRDALADNTRSPVPDQVQFRTDFPAWLGGLPPAKRRIAVTLALGHRTQDVARTFGVTPARISQLRRELRQGYLAFLTAGPPRRAGRLA